MSDAFLKVVIKHKDNTATEEEVAAISSFNENGPFDILPMHENFISVIKDKLVLHKKDGSSKEVALERGVLKIFKNEIDIYLGI
jgi:F0F1-type ATP synthase epsilon subunit